MVKRTVQRPPVILSVGRINRENVHVGEVRVPVEMRNGADVLRHAAGEIGGDRVRRTVEEGVVDTGAVSMAVPRRVADALELPVRRRGRVRLADGSVRETDIVGPITFLIEGREVDLSAHVTGNEVLIGQVALESTDLLVDCTNGRLVPNPEHPDGPILRT